MELKGKHWTVRAVDLYDKTDYHDSLLREQKLNLFQGNLPEVPGRIFFFEDPETDRGLVLTVQAPDYVRPTLKVVKGQIVTEDGGYPVTLTECKRGECERTCRELYRALHNRETLITMSNTWGDMNSRDRVYEDFVRREIDTAAELGVDIVQIDDGWQRLIPQDCEKDERGRRRFLDPFWELNEERFPGGMKAVTDYARAKGVRPGLWFAPDSGDGFIRKDRDLQVLKKAYDAWGMRFFKLDMLSVLNEEECRIFLDMLNTVRSFGPDADVELDVTNGIRLGYLCGAEHGILFAENRYAKNANYYPHRTLRNLWSLSRYLPACRFQFEIANPDLAPEAYGDDPFAPVFYDLDYLFASVAVSNPLFWMEMQFLTEERKGQLKRILPVWKEYREILAKADVSPLGEEPSGRAMTGFCARNGDDAYFILLREGTDRDTFSFRLPVSAAEGEILASNADVSLSLRGNTLTASFGKERAYIFARAKVQ